MELLNEITQRTINNKKNYTGLKYVLFGLLYLLLLFAFLEFFGWTTDIGKVGNYFLGVFSFSGTRLTTSLVC